jgi:hypothetical protein
MSRPKRLPLHRAPPKRHSAISIGGSLLDHEQVGSYAWPEVAFWEVVSPLTLAVFCRVDRYGPR